MVSPCCYYKVVASVLFILDQGNKDDEYPAEFKVLVDKQFLFKVEVSEGNVHKKYRNYAVKKATDDADAIAQFTSKYNLKVCIMVTICSIFVPTIIHSYINICLIQFLEF